MTIYSYSILIMISCSLFSCACHARVILGENDCTRIYTHPLHTNTQRVDLNIRQNLLLLKREICKIL